MSIRMSKRSFAGLGVFACTLVAILMVPVLRAQVGAHKQTSAPDASADQTPPAAAAKPPAKQPGNERAEATALIRVSGRARDTAGTPVAGAKVFLVSTN